MTHLDVFTGIGGFHLAAEWAGFMTVGFAEIDPFCCKLLAQKWPEIKNYGDIRNTESFSELRERISILSAGVPCQPASIAGKRRGAADDRWLWPATLDVVGSVQPAWCIFENPPGIASIHAFRGILLRLADLGYETRLFSVPANAVGAKHRRQRIFIVANSEVRRIRCGETQRESGQSAFSGQNPAAADTDTSRLEKLGSRKDGHEHSPAIRGCESLANAYEFNGDSGGFGASKFSQFQKTALQFRLTQPPLCRRTDGISHRSHRLKALGNSVVPQQAYPFFEAIALAEEKFLETEVPSK